MTSSVPALIDLLSKEQENQVRFEATRALVQIGTDAVPSLVEALSEPDTQSGAQEAVIRIGSPAIPALISALNHESGRVRGSSAAALIQIGADSLPPLTEALKHEDPAVRSSVIFTLSRFWRFPEVVVPAITDALSDEDAGIRANAAGTLGGLGEKAVSAIPALIETLDDEIAYVRRRAAVAIDAIAPETKTTVPRMVDVLKEEEVQKRLNEAQSHYSTGKFDDAIKIYRDVLNDQPNHTVHYRLAQALKAAGNLDEARVEYQRLLGQLGTSFDNDFLQPISSDEWPRFSLKDLYFELIEVERKTGNRESEQSVWKAFGALLKANAHPENSYYWRYLGESYFRVGQWQESRAALEKGITLRNETVPSIHDDARWWLLTMTLHQLGETDTAKQYYDQLVRQLDSNDIEPIRVFQEETAELLGIE